VIPFLDVSKAKNHKLLWKIGWDVKGNHNLLGGDNMKEIVQRILFFMLVLIISQVMVAPTFAEISSVESDIPDVHAHIGVIQAGIAGSQRVVLPHCGHLAHFEVPDSFNKVVFDFLKTTE
jgi:hypothetical protein